MIAWRNAGLAIDDGEVPQVFDPSGLLAGYTIDPVTGRIDLELNGGIAASEPHTALVLAIPARDWLGSEVGGVVDPHFVARVLRGAVPPAGQPLRLGVGLANNPDPTLAIGRGCFAIAHETAGARVGAWLATVAGSWAASTTVDAEATCTGAEIGLARGRTTSDRRVVTPLAADGSVATAIATCFLDTSVARLDFSAGLWFYIIAATTGAGLAGGTYSLTAQLGLAGVDRTDLVGMS